MKSLRVGWLLGLVVMAGGASTLYVTCPGCIDRGRINSACEWTGDTAFPVDASDAAHRKHLVSDAHIAEELAIRHADVEFGKRFGVEHHGGLIDGGSFRRECLSRMLLALESNHHVTSEQVQVARGGRNWIFDLSVSLLFLPFYIVGVIRATRWVSRRFPRDDRFARWVAAGLASIIVSFLGLQCLRLWGAVWEVIRVGNGHMTSMREASHNTWMHHVDGQLVGGILLFWVVSLCWSRLSSVEHATEDRLYGVLLR